MSMIQLNVTIIKHFKTTCYFHNSFFSETIISGILWVRIKNSEKLMQSNNTFTRESSNTITCCLYRQSGPEKENDTCRKIMHVKMVDTDFIPFSNYLSGNNYLCFAWSQINIKPCNNHVTFHTNIWMQNVTVNIKQVFWAPL